MNEQYVELPGRVVEVRPDEHVVVELDCGQRVLAHISGRLLHHGVRVEIGDRVTAGVLAYDPSRGRIVSRV